MKGENIMKNKLVMMLNKILDRKINTTFTKPRQGDIKHSVADITKAKKMLGYEPKISLEEGLKKTVRYYEEDMISSVFPITII